MEKKWSLGDPGREKEENSSESKDQNHAARSCCWIMPFFAMEIIEAIENALYYLQKTQENTLASILLLPEGTSWELLRVKND